MIMYKIQRYLGIAFMLSFSMSYAMDQEELAICRSIETEKENKRYFAALTPEARKSLINGYNKCRNAKQFKAQKEFAALKSIPEKHAYLIRYTKWIQPGS